MTIHNWVDPATSSGRDMSRDTFNKRLENLLTTHAGIADPPYKREYMLQVRSDLGVLQMRDGPNLNWITLGKIEANLGMVRKDGTTALDADLNFNGKVPKGVASFAATAGPTHTAGDMWFEIKDTGGNSFYFHCQQTKP